MIPGSDIVCCGAHYLQTNKTFRIKYPEPQYIIQCSVVGRRNRPGQFKHKKIHIRNQVIPILEKARKVDSAGMTPNYPTRVAATFAEIRNERSQEATTVPVEFNNTPL